MTTAGAGEDTMDAEAALVDMMTAEEGLTISMGAIGAMIGGGATMAGGVVVAEVGVE